MSSETGEDADYDVFICHASEDKEAVVRPLAEELRVVGLDVWYDEFEIGLGDSLRNSIDEGLRSSSFGVVVLSNQFFEKDWTEYELNGLVQRQMAEDKVILPLWYDVSKEDVLDYSPSLSDLRAEKISTDTIQQRASDIYSIVQNSDSSNEWGKSETPDSSGPTFESIEIRFQEYLNIEIGDRLTIKSWRNHGAPSFSELEAVEVHEEKRGIDHASNSKGTIMTVKTIEDEPLTGMVSDIEELSSGRTVFTFRVEQSRLEELSDDPDDYKSAL
jgi:hypothetical protein